MFKMVVKFRGSDQLLQMFFDDRLLAEKTASGIIGGGAHQTISDDYGQKLFVIPSDVSAAFVMDLEKAAVASGREAMVNAREQARVNMQAQRDPAMMMMQQGQPRPGLTRLG